MSEPRQVADLQRRNTAKRISRAEELPDSTSSRPYDASARHDFALRLGRRIRALRRRLSLSQAKLAGHLSIHRSRLAKWESGTHAPPPEMLPPLAQRLGVSLDELLTGQEAQRGRLSRAGRNLLRNAVLVLVHELGIDLKPEGAPHAELE
jgi:transcriptional regulator with XRE-family HTH domain